MLGEKEKQTLERINFPERFIKARNQFQYNPDAAFKLSKKKVLKLLKQKGLPFVAKQANIFYADVQKRKYTFRLLFDINKDLNPLTYIMD